MKEKKYLSRRQKARRSLTVLLLLGLLFAASGVYGILPGHAIRAAEALTDCRPTTVVRRLGWVRLPRSMLNQVYLCENEDCLLFVVAKFQLWKGWHTSDPGVVDCTGEAPVHAGIHIIWSSWNDTNSREYTSMEDYIEAYAAGQYDVMRYYAYGRVEDYRAMSVRVRQTWETNGGREMAIETEIPRSRWIWKDGRPYFVEEILYWETGDSFCEDAKEGTMEWQVQLLDEKGGVLYEAAVQDWPTLLSA